MARLTASVFAAWIAATLTAPTRRPRAPQRSRPSAAATSAPHDEGACRMSTSTPDATTPATAATTTLPAGTGTNVRRYHSRINGAARSAERTIARYAPGNNVKVAEVDAADAALVDEAVIAARRAFDTGPWP